MAHKLIIILFFFAFFCSNSNAQFSATVIDNSTNQFLAGASVNLKDRMDSTISFSTVTDTNGILTFSKLEKGNYLLTIFFMGYEKFTTSFIINEGIKPDLPDTIGLHLSEKTLSTITISGKKDFISIRPDKITINVEESPIASTGNAYEVILRGPGITEQNNSLSFRGKSVSVLINGRSVQLSGNELKTMLSTTPANNIEKVEILTDPSAKYDASGGIVINIKMARNKNYGFNGNYSLGATIGKYFGHNQGTNLNYRSKHINIYGGYNYVNNKQYYANSSERVSDKNSSIIEEVNEVRSLSNNIYSIGTDYEFNKYNTMGVLFRGYSTSRKRNVFNKTTLEETSHNPDSISTVNTIGEAKYLNPSLNIYYKSVLDTLGKELTINADYFSYDKKWKDNYTTNYFDNNKFPYKEPYFLRNQSPGHITVYSFSADYVSPVKNGNLEAGTKSMFTTTDNDVLWEYQEEGIWLKDLSKTNHFIYKENINAAYVNYSAALKNKIDYSIGLRAENTQNMGNSVTLNQISKKSFTNFFPAISFAYNKNDDNIFSISYRKSIYRFGFDVVNPFVIYKSQYSYYKGNPNIQPEISHNLNLSYVYKQSLVFGVSYTRILNNLAPVYIKGPDNMLISSQENLNSGDMFYFYNNWSKEVSKFWESNLSTMFGFLKYNLSTENNAGTNSNWVVQMQWDNSFNFKHGWNAELSANYLSPYASGIYKLQSLFSTDIGINKSFLNKKANIKLSVADVFNTYHQNTNTNYKGIVMNERERNETRFFRLRFTYKFGNYNVRKATLRDSKLEDVKSRLDK